MDCRKWGNNGEDKKEIEAEVQSLPGNYSSTILKTTKQKQKWKAVLEEKKHRIFSSYLVK